MAADFMREVWAAAGGFPDALPTAPGAERSVLALVRQIRAVAATVENPLAALGRDYAINFGSQSVSSNREQPASEPTEAQITAYLKAQAAAVDRMDTQPLSTGIWPREACREGLRAALAQAQRPAEPAPESGAVDKQEDA